MEPITAFIAIVCLSPFLLIAYPLGKEIIKKYQPTHKLAILSGKIVSFVDQTSTYLVNYFHYKTIWRFIHPDLIDTSKELFEHGYYRHAVLDAATATIIKVKNVVKTKIGRELDGTPLMQVAFSQKQPVICLADLGTETGRSIQQGFMHLFEGLTLAVRNPRAHELVVTDKEMGLDYLLLVSLLLKTIDRSSERNNS